MGRLESNVANMRATTSWNAVNFTEQRYVNGKSSTSAMDHQNLAHSALINNQIAIRSSALSHDFVGVFNTVNARHWKLDIVEYGTNGRVTIDLANISAEKDIQSVLAPVQIYDNATAKIQGTDVNIHNIFVAQGHTEPTPNTTSTFTQYNYENIGTQLGYKNLDQGMVGMVLDGTDASVVDIGVSKTMTVAPGNFLFHKTSNSNFEARSNNYLPSNYYYRSISRNN